MKRFFHLLPALLLIAALLAGCGAMSAPSSAKTAGESYYYAADQAAPAAAPALPAGGWMDNAAEAATTGKSVLPENVKLIYRADIKLESTAFDEAVAALQKLTADCGGYYENSGLDNYGSYRRASYTIRVPAENFEAFYGAVSEMGKTGEVFQLKTISRSAEDVSEYYYDTESRLATQKTKLARLQELLEQAEYMEDIITLESAISDTELAIEQLTGTLRHYDSLVGYSTVTLALAEVYKLTPTEEPAIGFSAKLAAAFKNGCERFVDNSQDFLIGFANAWVGWLIFLVIVALVILLIVRGTRRRRARRAARAQAEPASRPRGRRRMPPARAEEPPAAPQAPADEPPET